MKKTNDKIIKKKIAKIIYEEAQGWIDDETLQKKGREKAAKLIFDLFIQTLKLKAL